MLTNSSKTTGLAIKSRGLDVSYANNIDLSRAKEKGFEFAIIRLGIHDHKDTLFDIHYENALSAHLKIGAYWWIKATAIAEAEREAALALKYLGNRYLNLPLYVDFEDSIYFGDRMSRDINTDIVRAFCDYVDNRSNYVSGIYASVATLSNYLHRDKLLNKYDIWLAHWTGNGNLSPYDFGQSIQQYGLTEWEGNVKVDGDYMLMDVRDNEIGVLPIYTVAQECISGKWGNGSERKDKLEKAGYNYSEVQTAINNILNKNLREIFVENMLPQDYEDVFKLLTDKGYKVTS